MVCWGELASAARNMEGGGVVKSKSNSTGRSWNSVERKKDSTGWEGGCRIQVVGR